MRRPVDFALRPVIRVMDELGGRRAASERHHEGVDDEVGGLAFAHRPARHATVVEDLDPGEVELAVTAFELGDVRDPPLIGSPGGEVRTVADIGDARDRLLDLAEGLYAPKDQRCIQVVTLCDRLKLAEGRHGAVVLEIVQVGDRGT